MTVHIGDFGTPHESNDSTFGYFGTTFRVMPELSDLALIDFAEMAASIDKSDAMTALGSIKAMLRAVIHPDDFDALWKSAKAHGQTIEDMANLARRIVESLTERPTEQLSTSSHGQPSTGTSSGPVVSSRVMQMLEGRPDLQLVVDQAARAAV